MFEKAIMLPEVEKKNPPSRATEGIYQLQINKANNCFHTLSNAAYDGLTEVCFKLVEFLSKVSLEEEIKVLPS